MGKSVAVSDVTKRAISPPPVLIENGVWIQTGEQLASRTDLIPWVGGRGGHEAR